MKLTKENIYINLQGKSEEELTELYNFLESVGERQHRRSLSGFLENYKNYEVYNFNTTWTLGWYVNSKNKQEVTIEQLKEILQPMEMINLMGYSVLVDNQDQARKLQEIAIEQGFNWEYGDEKIKNLDEKSFQFGYKGKKIITHAFLKEHYQDQYITKKAHFNDLFKEETLQQKEQRLLKELEEVRKEIEDSKIKVGDWCKFWDDDKDEFIIGKFQEEYEDTYVTSDTHFYNCKKITNPQLIELLENESK